MKIENINQDLHKEIIKIHQTIKNDIEKTIKSYKNNWDKTEEEVFLEVAFCILTPQSKAKNAWKAITNLHESKKLYNGKAEKIAESLNIVRFKNNKAKYLVELRNLMTIDGKLQPKKILVSKGNVLERRKWIADNIKGMGVKEASHLLRNLGFGEHIAILDRHILRNLVALNIISEIPKPLTEKKYYEIEKNMQKYSEYVKISMDKLDLVLWYKEAGELFK